MDDQYTTQAPDWNSWVQAGDQAPPTPVTDPAAILAAKRLAAQQALMAAQPNASAPVAPAFNGLQEGQQIQPAPANWRPPVEAPLPVPPIPPAAPASPMASTMAPQAPAAPASPLASALAAPSPTPSGTPPGAPMTPPAPPPSPLASALAAPSPTPSGTPPGAPMTPVGVNPNAPVNFPLAAPQPTTIPPATSTIAGIPPAGAPSPGPGVPAGQTLPRGLRNNNPLNLEYRPDQGAVGSDGRFGVFPTMEAGIAAAQKQLLSYQDNRDLNTVASIIGRWAPSSENNTSAYASTVAKSMGVGVDDKIDLHQPATMSALVSGMSAVENGTSKMVGPGTLTGGSGAGGGSASPTVTAGSPATPLNALQQQSTDYLKEMSTRANNTNLPYPNAGAPQSGNTLLALAGGILSGNSLAHGLGQGFENAANVGQEQQKNMMQANQQHLSLATLGINSDRYGANILNQLVNQGNAAARVATGQGGLAVREATLADKTSGASTDRQIGAATIRDTVDENNKQIVDLGKSAEGAQDTINHVNAIMPLLQQAGAGPTFADKAVRALAQNFGIDAGSDQSTAQVVQSMVGGLQSGTLKNLGIGRIMQAEIPMLTSQVASLNTNPAAAAKIGEFITSRAQGSIDAFQEFSGMSAADKRAILQAPGSVGHLRLSHMPTVDTDGNIIRAGNASAPTQQAPASSQGSIQMTGPKGTFMVPPDKVALFKQNGYQ